MKRSPAHSYAASVERVLKVAGKTGTPIDPRTLAVAVQALGGADANSPGMAPQPSMVPGVFNRLKQAGRYLISGVGPENFFGPWQPIRPMAEEPQKGVVGRQLDYPTGYNVQITPRSGEEISFPMLRALGDNYDLMRLAIETCKDQIESYEWEIVAEDKLAADQSNIQSEIDRLSAFWEYPDREHNWQQWLRMVLEDMLVIDAVCIYPSKNRGGGLYSLDLMDGGMIRRIIDEYGRTPLPPDPAYQQIIKGVPAVNYTREDLMYVVRNPRTHKLYGYSPVEQVLATVNIAMRRQLHQLQYYTEGNIPEALVSLPDGWTSAQIKDFQDWFDSMLEGNTAARRHIKFLPEVKQFYNPKENALKDDYDEWLARIICWSFSIPANALIKQQNRAASEQQAETAKEEGQGPRLRFLAGLINNINKTMLDAKGVKFAWKTIVSMDPYQQAQSSQIYYNIKALTPDEIREDLGRTPLSPEEREAAWPTPPMLDPEIGGQKLDAQGNPMKAPPPEPGALKAKDDEKGSTGDPVGKYLGAQLRLRKSKARETNVSRAVSKSCPKMITAIKAIFAKQGAALAHHAALLAHTSSLSKAQDDEVELGTALTVEEIAERVQAIVDQLDAEGISVVIIEELTPEIETMYMLGGRVGLDQVGFESTEEIVAHLDAAAVAYAQERSAQLVTGLTETTRDAMQTMLADGIERGMSTDELADYLQDGFGFSDSRAEMIARTELADAHVQGNVQGWRETGKVEGKRWILGDNHDVEDECDECADSDPIALDEDFETTAGPIDFPPAHPKCVCDVVPVLVGEMPDDQSTEDDASSDAEEQQ